MDRIKTVSLRGKCKLKTDYFKKAYKILVVCPHFKECFHHHSYSRTNIDWDWMQRGTPTYKLPEDSSPSPCKSPSLG